MPSPLLLLLFSLTPLLLVESSDLRSLLEFKKGIATPLQWPPGSPTPCYWPGVTCDATNAVVSLDLSNLNLSGDLKFTTLTPILSLRNLSLSGNSFTGRLVPALGALSSLQRLDLSRNLFTGKIPDRISELSNLLHLNLSGNSFSETVPAGIRNLQQLRELDFSSNGLWGDIESVLAGLRFTEHVDLSGNGFSGGLAVDLVSLSSLVDTLRFMNLSNNKLGGGFLTSEAVRLFKNLEVLDLSNNQLTGELPEFDSVVSLRVLRVGGNRLSGEIPGGVISSAMSLVELDLSGNGFTGEIQLMNATNLKVLNLSSNALSGPLPSNIGGCTSVDLSVNMFSGDLSVLQNWGDTVEVVDLSSNLLSGDYPSEAFRFRNLVSIKISNNSVVGNLPSVLRSYPRLAVIDLSLNKLTGPILSSLFTSLTLTSLNLSGNFFTGTIPFQGLHSTESLVLPSVPHLESLDLSDNSFSGSLPQEIGTMQRLKLLNLRNNNLSGELPSELSKLSELEFLDLSSNHFKGRIPEMQQPGLKVLNLTYNDLSGTVPQSLNRFPSDSLYPGNDLLTGDVMVGANNRSQGSNMKSRVRVAFIVGSVGAVMLIFFIFMAFYRMRSQEFCGRNGPTGQSTGRDRNIWRCGHPIMFRSPKDDSVPNSMSFSNDHLLTSASRSLSGQKELLTETVEYGYSNTNEKHPVTIGMRSSPGSPLSSSPRFMDPHMAMPPVTLDVYSPDRLAGELFFLDNSLVFTAEELSRAPAEVLGRSSHGTSYKATLDNGHLLTVKWLRVGLVKQKKEFAKEAKSIGIIRHPNIISWRGYYWGPREQERLIITDYVHGDSLALYLYESTPRRYSRLSVTQRLKIAIDIARCLYHLQHDWGISHGNLKPSNILLTGPDLTARLTDFGLHRLMTPTGMAEQLLNLGALGYRAPELATTSKPLPSFKADVYAFGVILLELLTRKSAGDIISGQSGAVDLTDWVQLCSREGRGTDCFDRDIAGLEEAPRAMDELLAISLRCILPVNERPNIRTVYDDLSSISM